MSATSLLKLGIVGTVVAALCCFTPLLVMLLAGIGLSAWVGYLDVVLLPLLVFFIALVLYALWQKGLSKENDHDKRNHS